MFRKGSIIQRLDHIEKEEFVSFRVINTNPKELPFNEDYKDRILVYRPADSKASLIILDDSQTHVKLLKQMIDKIPTDDLLNNKEIKKNVTDCLVYTLYNNDRNDVIEQIKNSFEENNPSTKGYFLLAQLYSIREGEKPEKPFSLKPKSVLQITESNPLQGDAQNKCVIF